MSSEERTSGRKLPVLTTANWTEFKMKFINHAQKFGEAGRALLMEREPDFAIPDSDAIVIPCRWMLPLMSEDE